MRHPAAHNWLAMGALLMLGIICFAPLLFSGEIVNATDVLTQQYVWNAFTQENLATDPCFKTWLPYINAGAPFNGGLDKVFRPVTLLSLLLLPAELTVNYEMVAYFLVFGISMFWYLRELRLSAGAAFLGALFLMLNGEVVTLLNAGHVTKLGTIAFTPLVFWALERALQRKTFNAFLLTAVMLAIQFWQTHIQIAFYTCLAVAVYFLVRMATLYRKHRSGRQIGTLFLFAVIMVIVYLLLSAVWFVPMLAFQQVSDRSEGVSYEFATSWSMPPEELLTYVIPDLFGLRRANHFEDEPSVEKNPYWGRMPFTQTGRYFGLLPLLFMGLALCFVRQKHVLALAAVALFALLLGMGRYIPTYRLLYEYVPGFNMFRVPQMILFLFAFASSGLAGIGADWFFGELSERRERRLRLFLLVCLAVALAAWLLTLLFPQMEAGLFERFHASLMRKDATPELARERLHHIFRGLVAFNVFFGLSVLALGLRLNSRIAARRIFVVVLLVYLVDVSLFNEKYIDTIPLEGSWYVSEHDTIRYVKQQPGLYRVFPLVRNSPTYTGAANKYVLHHVFSVLGYEAVQVKYYREYMQTMALGSPMIDLLNIKYIALSKDVEFTEPKPAIGGMIGPYRLVMDSDAILLKNPHALPRAFPVHQASVVSPADDILAAMQQPDFAPAETVFLEEEPPHSGTPGIPASESTVAITEYANRDITMRASMAADGFVVLSEKYYPGWKAYVDGQPTKIYKADYTLQAIAVPQGEHEILFSFRPTDFQLGLWITIVTGLGLAAFWITGKTAFGKRVQRSLHRAGMSFMARLAMRLSGRSALLWGLIAFGIIAHAGQYLFNRSLNTDEAGMALTIIHQPWRDLLFPFSASDPLIYNKIVPPGFLLLTKGLTRLFGSSEYVLRLLPFLGGILSPIIFLRSVAPYVVTRERLPLALTLFVCSGALLLYSSDLKQYSFDVLIALALYAVALPVLSGAFRPGRLAGFAIAGALAVWFSHAAVFVLAGIGACFLGYTLTHKAWTAFKGMLLVSSAWGLSFFGLYWMSLRHAVNIASMQQFWDGAFLQIPPSSFTEATMLLRFWVHFPGFSTGLSQALFAVIASHSPFRMGPLLGAMMESPTAIPPSDLLVGMLWPLLYGLLTMLTTWGLVALAREERFKCLLLVSPMVFVWIASAMQAFPLADRVLLFLVPMFLLLLTNGIGRAGRYLRPWGYAMLIIVVLAYPVGAACYHLAHPRVDQEIKPVLAHISANWQPDDAMYVYYGAQTAFTYYAPRYGFQEDAYTIGTKSRTDWNAYFTDISALFPQSRVWILFSHVYGYEHDVILEFLDMVGGQQLEAVPGIKAAAYLYDLSRAHTPAS